MSINPVNMRQVAELVLRDEPQVWSISTGECSMLLVRWLTRPVAPYGDSSNYVSGVCSFVVRSPCIGTLWCEYWSVSYYEWIFLGICGRYDPGKRSAVIQAISDTVPRDGANRAQKLRLGLLSNYDKTTVLQDNFNTDGAWELDQSQHGYWRRMWATCLWRATGEVLSWSLWGRL
jgi:hypothetical protein